MPASGQQGTTMAFVVSTGAGKPNPELRKLIRSHVMLGKNRGKTLRPRTKIPKVVEESSPSRDDDSAESSSSLDLSATEPYSVIPHKVGSDLSTIRFADIVDPHAVEMVLRFSSIAKKTLFPLASCLVFEKKEEVWIAPLAFDAAYLHALIFSTHDYFNTIIRGKTCTSNQQTLPHFVKTLQLLRERLLNDDDPARLSPTTASIVQTLAAHAHFMGDSTSAKHHLQGLHKIVRLRGGVAALRSNAKLLIEILRCDIGIALDTGSKTMFFRGAALGEPLPSYPAETLPLSPEMVATFSPDATTIFLVDIDDALVRAWRVLTRFCQLINLATISQHRIPTEMYLDTMTSVIYRLMDMSFEVGSADEALRLGLLAFSTSVFLQWKQLGRPYNHLASVYRESLASVGSSHLASPLLLWLYVVGAISVLEPADIEWLKPWLWANVDLHGIHSWSDLRSVLEPFMWIGLIHDGPSKGIFPSAFYGEAGICLVDSTSLCGTAEG